MKRILVLLGLFFALQPGGHAQVTIQATLPPAGVVQQNQLWNLLLINATGDGLSCRLDLVLRDRQTGLQVFAASTAPFVLSRGSRHLNAAMLAPIQYRAMSPTLRPGLNGLLPVGSYNACYALFRVMGDASEQVSEDCIPFDVQPLSPPELTYPRDSADLDIAPTAFTWIPPTPDKMFNQLQFDIRIAEIKPGQRAEQAIQENMPLYQGAALRMPTLSYPHSAPTFKEGTWYAWQVVARDAGTYAARTESWVFRVHAATREQDPAQGLPFVRLSAGRPELGIAPDGLLKIAYLNDAGDSSALVEVRDVSAGAGQVRCHFNLRLQPGENLIRQVLPRDAGLNEDDTYEVTLVNGRHEEWKALIRIRKIAK